ncbi:hypothetical protein TBR22_A43600 [Luteitalea sp. TBR-22]|uniref:hypothetical protein n=1 Tax=Luteitalea sp. TBR-22 TaxID=2802971 RepID=UPI001AF55ABC|nr:hypothetical protein [Luteitalea sp. TBR-22]BCS35134.1 hypothetical protein TBR22_A43600 [Luteitalea sp. TBR-22]
MRSLGHRAVALPAACLLAGGLLAGCAAAPRQKPLRTTAVDTGTTSMEAVRRQLEGSWTLVSLTAFDAAGAPKALQATGRLTYDAYGNLELSASLADPAAAGPGAGALAMKGRAVVDTSGKRLVMADVMGQGAVDTLPATLTPDKVRYYAFEGGTLSLETRDGTRVLTRTVWKKAQ